MIVAAFVCVEGSRIRQHLHRGGTFEEYCTEQRATLFSGFCTCDDSDAVCQKGEVVGCGAGNSEKKKFSKEEWQNGEEPKCVPDTCLTDKQAKLSYDKDNSRWFCECSNPNAHCFSAGAHCPFESGLQFPKQFSTTCSTCMCKISSAKKFWGTGSEEYDTLCGKGAGIFDSKDSQTLGQLTCNCAEGKHVMIDGKRSDSFNPLTCPDCTCAGAASKPEIKKEIKPEITTTTKEIKTPEIKTPSQSVKKNECIACGFLVAPEEDGRTMQYEVTAPQDTGAETSLFIKVYKTRPGAEASDETLRSGEHAVQLTCGKLDQSVGAGLYADLKDDKAALLCTGSFEYKRSRHGPFAHFGQQKTQMTLQLISSGTKEDPFIYVKEARDDAEDGDWTRVVLK